MTLRCFVKYFSFDLGFFEIVLKDSYSVRIFDGLRAKCKTYKMQFRKGTAASILMKEQGSAGTCSSKCGTLNHSLLVGEMKKSTPFKSLKRLWTQEPFWNRSGIQCFVKSDSGAPCFINLIKTSFLKEKFDEEIDLAKKFL